jgi:hypothetical protein
MKLTALLFTLVMVTLCSACNDNDSGAGGASHTAKGAGPASPSAFAAPELNPGTGSAALLLLAGSLAVIRGRRK